MCHLSVVVISMWLLIEGAMIMTDTWIWSY